MGRLPFPLFLSFMLFLIWFNFNRVRMAKKSKRADEDFWEKESKANATRKQSLDALPYILIPINELPFQVVTNEEVTAIETKLRALAKEKIVNFTGVSNTELKLRYGAGNLEILTQYDENYTKLVQLLYLWGEKLSELSYQKEAIQVLEYGVRIQTDIRAHYLLLANLYRNTGQSAKIQGLIEAADTLNSLNKNGIIRGLVSLQTAGSDPLSNDHTPE